MVEALTRIQHGWHHDPFEWLGVHPGRPGYVVRAFMPSAESVELDGVGPMSRYEGTDTFEIRITKDQRDELPQHYRIDRKSTRLNSSHRSLSRMPSSA